MKKGVFISTLVVLIGLALVVYAIIERTSAASAPRTLNLAEFGVALTIPGTLNELTYTAREEKETGTVLHAYIATGCDLGAFYEIQKDAVTKSGTSWTKETLEQFRAPQGDSPAQVKEFTDFYLVFEPNPDTCATDEKGRVSETKKRLDLWNALTTARYMSY